jgi:hypothetical protein
MSFNSYLSRRDLLRASGLGMGSVALACMLKADTADQRPLDLRPKPRNFPSKVRSVIQLVQNGGPSHMDLFDPKPELTKRDGQPHTVKVEMFQPGSEANQLMASPFEFRKFGNSGMDFSEALTHTPSIADDICLIRSMKSEHNNHLEALVMFQTCKIFPGRPTMGAWISYALGTESQNLPAYIVLRDPEGYNTSGSLLWDNGWLPALYRGTEFNSQGAPVLNLRPAKPMPEGVERANLEFLARLNEEQRLKYPRESDLEARIRNYELAARMQLTAGNVVDISKESEATKKLYGIDNPISASYGTRCLMARRLVEAGVRFVQIFPPIKPSIQPWDSHSNIKTELPEICARTEAGAVGLVKDLKSRGLLDNTLVIWAGEFGRLPVSQNGKGRDHNRNAFTIWLAGGGFKAGYTHGATDEAGYKSVENPVTVPDLHATVLHQLGVDHQRLIYNHQGRPETMTDFQVTGAHVIRDLLQSPAQG